MTKLETWSKCLRIVLWGGMIIHTLIIAVSFVWFQQFPDNDFRLFYHACEIFLTDINSLYTNTAFRYFPLSPLFYLPFYACGYRVGYVVLLLFNFFVRLGIISLLLHLKRPTPSQNFSLYILACFFLITFHTDYAWGQNMTFIGFLFLATLYFCLKNNFFVAGLCLVGAVALKPFLVIIYPFLLDFNPSSPFKFRISKSSLLLVLPLGIWCGANLIPFLLFPSLFHQFLMSIFNDLQAFNVFSISLPNFLLQFGIPHLSGGIICILFLFLYGPILGLYFVHVYRLNLNKQTLPLQTQYLYLCWGLLAIFISYSTIWASYLHFIFFFFLLFDTKREFYAPLVIGMEILDAIINLTLYLLHLPFIALIYPIGVIILYGIMSKRRIQQFNRDFASQLSTPAE